MSRIYWIYIGEDPRCTGHYTFAYHENAFWKVPEDQKHLYIRTIEEAPRGQGESE